MTPPSSPAPAVVEQLFAALRAGDAAAVWELFASEARSFIVNRGVRKGMAAEFGAAVLSGTADPRELAHFLDDLLAGLHRDLERVNLERVVVADQTEPLEGGAVKVQYLERFVVPVGPPLDPLPVGSVELIVEDGTWKVRKIVPRPG